MIQETSYKVYYLRNRVRAGSLTWQASSAPSVIVDADAEICSSFGGSFLYSDDFDVLRDELNPVIIIDGTERSLGVYPVTTSNVSVDENGVKWLTVEGYDRSWRAKATKTERVLHFAAGTSYTGIVVQLLNAVGIVNLSVVRSDEVLSVDREDWPVGTEYLKIINTLLSEIGYQHLWIDLDGVAHVEPYKSISSRNIAHKYSSGDLRLAPMATQYSAALDIWDAPNVFICICENPENEGGAMSATAINDAVNSPKSIVRRGIRIPEVTKVNQIASQSALQTYANRLRDQSLMTSQNIVFYSPQEGGHGVGDIVAIDHPDLLGIYYERGFKLTLQAGTLMTHTVMRTVYAS